MRQTLFHIPIVLDGVPLFGFGVLLAVWAVVSVVLLAALIRRQGFNEDTRSYLPILGMFGGVIFILPRIADAGGLPVRGFGVMLLLAMSAGGWLALRRARQMRVDVELILSLAFWLFLFGIVGARLFYVVQKWPQFRQPTWGQTLFALFNVTQGGLVVYGSLIAAGAGLLIFCRRHKLSALAVCDLIAPSLLIGLAIGRIGCLMNGCCFGGLCDHSWAVTFPWRSPPHERQAQLGQVDLHGLYVYGDPQAPPVIQSVVPDSPAAQHGLKAGDRIQRIGAVPVNTVEEAQSMLLFTQQGSIAITVAGDSQPRQWQLAELPRSKPVHPTQLYSSFDAFLLCGLLWTYYPFRRRDGEATALMLTVYPITRFLIESLRTDEPKNILGMTISQNISLLMLALAVSLWFYIWRQPEGTAFGEPASMSTTTPPPTLATG